VLNDYSLDVVIKYPSERNYSVWIDMGVVTPPPDNKPIHYSPVSKVGKKTTLI
jgi:hypothetical protein